MTCSMLKIMQPGSSASRSDGYHGKGNGLYLTESNRSHSDAQQSADAPARWHSVIATAERFTSP